MTLANEECNLPGWSLLAITISESTVEVNVNCAQDCINGSILGNKCPNKQYLAEASQFINGTSLDKMLELAAVRPRAFSKLSVNAHREEARLKKLSQPPK
ncbi:hypothetical protein LYNGBM3L_51610 [Moorena producens 3L]|uniref:Uncharacterized protein n=1 Tax=Moorena producens 3L TaxID=489825 RepID=F4XYE5_9CYAN|nr:hypothetical protein LYNGBM3L_51610 [Moorena producens 3L]